MGWYSFTTGVGFTYKSLADGQLSASKATLYTCPASTSAIVSKIHLVNTGNSEVKVNIYFKASGGTSRRICPKDMILKAGYMAVLDDEVVMEAADIIEGDAIVASVIDYVISGVQKV